MCVCVHVLLNKKEQQQQHQVDICSACMISSFLLYEKGGRRSERCEFSMEKKGKRWRDRDGVSGGVWSVCLGGKR